MTTTLAGLACRLVLAQDAPPPLVAMFPIEIADTADPGNPAQLAGRNMFNYTAIGHDARRQPDRHLP